MIDILFFSKNMGGGAKEEVERLLLQRVNKHGVQKIKACENKLRIQGFDCGQIVMVKFGTIVDKHKVCGTIDQICWEIK